MYHRNLKINNFIPERVQYLTPQHCCIGSYVCNLTLESIVFFFWGGETLYIVSTCAIELLRVEVGRRKSDPTWVATLIRLTLLFCNCQLH